MTRTLNGKHLTLTQTGLEAAKELLAVFNSDEQFNAWSGYGPRMSLAEVRTELQETQQLPDGIVWQIRNASGMLVGVAETTIFPPPQRPWIALLLIHYAFQRCGCGSEAASLLEDYLFLSPETTHIALAVLGENVPALTFWKKRGYVQGSRVLDTHGNEVYLHVLARRVSKP